jgi:hypothetical protein
VIGVKAFQKGVIEEGTMRKDIRRRRDAHVRTSGVCTEHSAIFDATAGGRKNRTALEACVADADRQLTLQKQSIEDRRSSTEQIRRGRSALRDFAGAIVKIGRLVNVEEPLMTTLRLPGSTSDDDLVAYVRGLHERVSAHAEAFAAEGLPPDVLQKLATEIDRFVAAKDLQTKSRQRFAAATAALRQAQHKAGKTIAALEAIAISTPAAQPEVLTKLRVAKRVGPRAADDAETSPPAPVPSPAPSSTTPTVTVA